MKRNGIAGILAAVLLSAWSLPAGAEETYKLDPVLVTAEKRTENVQDVPVSVTAISEQQIKDSGIRSIQDVARQVPNLFIANWGFRGNSYAFIRGIGAVNNDPAIGFYVDDVNYMDSRVFDTNLFDIERIEVLRGPQGTLYGRNSLGGVVNIVTKKPDNEFHYGLEQTVGNENLYETTLYMRAPLIKDKLFFGVSGTSEQMDGYNTNDFLDKKVDRRRGLNGRMQLRWMPTDKLDVTANVDGEKVNDGVFPLTDMDQADKNPHHVSYNYEGRDKRDTLGSSLRVAYDAPWFKVTSITAYRGYNDVTRNDQDFMPYDLITAREDIKDRQFTQEFRFASPEGSGPLKWLGGLYLYKKHQDHTLDLNYGQGAADMGMVPMAMTNTADSDIKTYGYAVFGQATYTLFDKLDLTAGLRYEYEKNKLDYASDYLAGGMVVPGMGSDIRGRKHDDVFLPKAQIAYRWTPDFMTYAGVSRGYRSGGFNTSFLDVSDLAFDPEYSWNYEVGFKSSWFNNRVNFNTSLFYIDLSDQQVTQVLPTANTVIRNAGKSRSMGFEVEASALITEGLLFEGSFGYTDAKYRRYSDKVSGMDYAGNRTPLAPEYTYNLALQYSLPLLESFDFFHKEDSLTWITRAELQGVGKFYWNDANTLKQDPYELVNLRTGLETDNYSITFWAKNVFDKKYNCVAFAFSGSSALAQVGAPRSFGVTFRADF
ncbi:TonB-dependent receptor [Bilophila wadsworthia]|uniref:TonB-dependent receptor n=1 Tax=Bilophila wadsworthia TaxID=35833 RepID=UPI00266BA713|nr:TonB-dependent receptor [Bilophila wadsworthia]